MNPEDIPQLAVEETESKTKTEAYAGYEIVNKDVSLYNNTQAEPNPPSDQSSDKMSNPRGSESGMSDDDDPILEIDDIDNLIQKQKNYYYKSDIDENNIYESSITAPMYDNINLDEDTQDTIDDVISTLFDNDDIQMLMKYDVTKPPKSYITINTDNGVVVASAKFKDSENAVDKRLIERS